VSAIIGLAPVSAHIVVAQVLKTLIILSLLVIGFRFLGKRQAAQLNVYDLAMLLALSNAVQNAMTGGRGNLTVGLATSAAILGSAWAATRLFSRRPSVEARVIGAPTILVRHGRVLAPRLRRELVTKDELLQALRQHGIDAPRDVDLAVLEVDGSISVIARGMVAEATGPADRRPRRRRLRRRQ
jgi:uncharacterized membrane protein YcaP (DUF421 family)